MSKNYQVDTLNAKIIFRHHLKRWIGGILILLFSILYVFPVIYMFEAGFMNEYQAVDPHIFFTPTLDTFKKVIGGSKGNSSMLFNLKNTVILSIGTTLACLVLGVLASYSICFTTFRKASTNGSIYNWIITTILLPPVAVIVPIYLVFKTLDIFGQLWTILVLYIGFHLPLAIWLMHSFLADVPMEIIEAARVDGAKSHTILMRIVVPIARTGIIMASLLVFVFAWNEFFIGYQLSSNTSAPLTVYLARFREQEGLFVAQMSASCSLASLPPLIAGFVSQKTLMKGLTAGAVKG